MQTEEIRKRLAEALVQFRDVGTLSTVLCVRINDAKRYGLKENPVDMDLLRDCTRKLKQIEADMLRLRADLIEYSLAQYEPLIPNHLPEDL